MDSHPIDSSLAPLHSISNEKKLTYADVQFTTSPSPHVHQSPHTTNYSQVDLATVEALSRTAKQNEGDKKFHAQEMAKKLGPRYENSVMWTTQLSKVPVENELEGEEAKNLRRATDLPTKQTDDVFQPRRTSTDVPGVTLSEFTRQNYENLTLHDVPYPSGDYENVNIGGNYENILFSSTSEQEKGLHSN